jgi:hypothetical protein
MSLDLEQPAQPDSAAVVEDTAPPATNDADTAPVEREFDDDGLPIEAAAPVDDEEEDDLDGVKIRGKKEALEKLRAERLMHKDYTQKTQNAAEQLRTAEATKAQYQQAAQVQQHFAAELGEMQVIDRQLAQYAQVNWQQWADQDAAAASKAHMAFTQLQTRRGQLWAGVTEKHQQLQTFNEREDAKRSSEAEAVVAREIKDWGPEKYRALQEFAEAKGVDKESLRRMLVNVPKSAAILTDAMKWRQLEQQRAKKPPVAPAPPVTRLSGVGAAATKEPSQMSDSEFAAWRKRQIAQRK